MVENFQSSKYGKSCIPHRAYCIYSSMYIWLALTLQNYQNYIYTRIYHRDKKQQIILTSFFRDISWITSKCLICFYRDLLKWCSRIARDFDVSKTTTGSMVFQEALDCFAACLSRMEKRLPLAEAIGAKLNITKVKVRVCHIIKNCTYLIINK